MSPFYRRLPHPPGFSVESSADKIGAALAVGTAAVMVAHGVGRVISGKNKEKDE